MYKIIAKRKKDALPASDYMFKEFKDFYEIAPNIIMPLFGFYTIVIQTDDVEEIYSFIRRAHEFEHLQVSIYVAKNVAEYLSMRDAEIVMESSKSNWAVFEEIIRRKQLLFGKKVALALYNSIEHSADEMEKALEMCLTKWGTNQEITKLMLQEFFMLNNIVYPRQVLVSYLTLKHWRANQLKRCIDQMGKDIVIGSFTKNIKAIFEEKTKYFAEGKATNFIRMLPTHNVTLMYRILVLERNGINDIELLLYCYERGFSPYDIVQRSSGLTESTQHNYVGL